MMLAAAARLPIHEACHGPVAGDTTGMEM